MTYPISAINRREREKNTQNMNMRHLIGDSQYSIIMAKQNTFNLVNVNEKKTHNSQTVKVQISYCIMFIHECFMRVCILFTIHIFEFSMNWGFMTWQKQKK